MNILVSRITLFEEDIYVFRWRGSTGMRQATRLAASASALRMDVVVERLGGWERIGPDKEVLRGERTDV